MPAVDAVREQSAVLTGYCLMRHVPGTWPRNTRSDIPRPQPTALHHGENRPVQQPGAGPQPQRARTPWRGKPTLKIEPLPVFQGGNDLLNFGLHVPQRVARVDASDHQGEAKLRENSALTFSKTFIPA